MTVHTYGRGAGLWEPPAQTSDSTRAEQIVTIGDQRVPYPDETVRASFLPTIHLMIARFDLKRRLPKEDGGFRCESKETLGLQEMRHAGKRVVSRANLQETTRTIGPSPPGRVFHEPVPAIRGIRGE